MNALYQIEIDKLKAAYNKRLGEKKKVADDFVRVKTEKATLEFEHETLQKAQHVLTISSVVMRDSAKAILEQTVTSALQFVSNGMYSFEIELDKLRGKPSCELYVVSNVNGITSKQRPEDACGGGFVDIISTALRYVFLNIFDNPKINGPIILDEPGKMVSEQASIKFAEFLKDLGKTFNRQTIVITHKEDIVGVSDNVKIVTKPNDKSIVQDFVI